MEIIGLLLLLTLIMVGVLFAFKNGKVINWWMSTPHYDVEYKKKMLKREIEDATDELNRLEE